jgi:hypothetical protein
MAIDSRGAGLIIACPDCQQSVQVPGLPAEEKAALASEDAGKRIQILSESLASSQAKVERLVASLEEIRERRKYLEKLRSDNMVRFEQIGKELITIQNAMDRIVGMLQDAAEEKVSGDA